MVVNRRLTAIMIADVAGYSRLIAADEIGTLAALKERRKAVFAPLVKAHSGRIVKFMGDGALVEFASAVNAVACALAIQERMVEANEGLDEYRRIDLRIGINLGDVVGEGSDIFGDGVNVAARLEALANPGGLCIAGNVHEAVRGKLEFSAQDMGEIRLKNIAHPVRAFHVKVREPAAAQGASTIPLPAKPSIAVLPFVNMSGDPEQEFFTDGLTEDIITDLSNVPGLFVIARNSTFSYKGKPTDVRVIARDLGVRYVLEGSARRSAQRLRINVQLIDAAGGGSHIWAERFDRELADIFAVQDEVTRRVVEAISGRLSGRPAAERYRPSNLEAYDLCVRARPLWVQSKISAREGRALLEQALRLEPNYAEAYWRIALAQLFGWLHWGEEQVPLRAAALESAQRAVALDPNDSGARWVLGFVLLYEKEWVQTNEHFNAALAMNPNDADALAIFSDTKVMNGQGADAIAIAEKALRLNPLPPGWYYWTLGQAQVAGGRYQDAITTLRREETYRTGSRRILAAALALAGQIDAAHEEARFFMSSNPHWRISTWAETQPFQKDHDMKFWIDAYRVAGLPM